MDRRAALLMVFLISVLFAGPNKDAKLSFDFSIGTDAIDTLGGCRKDSTITTAIKISGASKLYSYEFFVSYDTASLQFIAGKAGNDANENILNKNGGSGSFSTVRSKKDSTQLRITCYLMGDDASQCVSDDGLLGLITFKHVKEDTTHLSIASRKFLDCDLAEDTALEYRSGTIIPADVGVIHHRRHVGSSPEIIRGKGCFSVDFGRRTNYVLTAVTIQGKELHTDKGISDRIRFDGWNTSASAPGSNLVIVRIRYSENELVVPLLR